MIHEDRKKYRESQSIDTNSETTGESVKLQRTIKAKERKVWKVIEFIESKIRKAKSRKYDCIGYIRILYYTTLIYIFGYS